MSQNIYYGKRDTHPGDGGLGELGFGGASALALISGERVGFPLGSMISIPTKTVSRVSNDYLA